MTHAWDGYAKAKGIVKPFDESKYPDRDSREELHQKLRSRGDA
jgi:hypothetical protein